MRNDPVKLVFFLLAVMIVIFLAAPAWSDANCVGHSCNDSTPNISIDNASPVSNSVSHSSRAFGLSGGDIDIAQSYRSYSVLFGLYQDTKVNPLELARQLVAEGYYQEAAELRCAPRTVYKALGGKEACIAKFSLPPLALPVAAEEDNWEEEEEEWHEEQMQMQQDYDERIAQLEQRPAPTATTIIKQSRFTDEQKAALRAEVAK